MSSLKSNLHEKIAFLRLKAGDADAFGFFYDQYVERIYRFILLRVSDKQIAEDLTQDVFLKTWQHLVDKRDISSFAAFIFRIARNTVIDHYRRKKQSLPLEYAETIVQDTVSVAESVDQGLDISRLLDNMQQLKSEYQEIILLRYVEELSIDEIAEVMQKDKNNIRVLLHRATAKLKSLANAKT